MAVKHWLAGTSILGVGAAIVLAIGWHASEQVIHPPQVASVVSPDVPAERVSFASRDGLTLAGWFIAGTNGATVILAHGRGSDHRPMLSDAALLNASGFSAFLFDFRYRGQSEGAAQTLGAKEAWDVESALDYLQTRPDVDATRIGIHGNSMGAVAAILAAAGRPEIRGVIAEIPFASANSLLGHTFRREIGLPSFPFAYVTKWICEWRVGFDFDRLAPVEVIGQIAPRPVLLIDDAGDRLFPPDAVELLHQAAGEPKTLWQIPACPHGKARECAPEEYLRRMILFWQETLGAPAAANDLPPASHPAAGVILMAQVRG